MSRFLRLCLQASIAYRSSDQHCDRLLRRQSRPYRAESIDQPRVRLVSRWCHVDGPLSEVRQPSDSSIMIVWLKSTFCQLYRHLAPPYFSDRSGATFRLHQRVQTLHRFSFSKTFIAWCDSSSGRLINPAFGSSGTRNRGTCIANIDQQQQLKFGDLCETIFECCVK